MVNWSQSNSHNDLSPSSIPRPAAPRFGASSASLQYPLSRLPAHSNGRTYDIPPGTIAEATIPPLAAWRPPVCDTL